MISCLAFQHYNIPPEKRQPGTLNQKPNLNIRRKDMARRGPEGLSYVLQFRPGEPQPPEPTAKDIVEAVVKFCLEGLRDENDALRKDDLGEMTGVVNWLIGDGVTTANFYTTETPAPMLFVSLPDSGSDPWSRIPGFMPCVKAGELTLNLINKGEIRLTARTEIDTALTKRVQTFRGLPPPARDNLAKALLGVSDLDEAIRQTEELKRDQTNPFF
jgi:hypothetical protein